MILLKPVVPLDLLERTHGWHARPEGLCKGDRCVPIPPAALHHDDAGSVSGVDAAVLASRLGMSLIVDEKRSLWALGPEHGGHVLTSAEAPDLTLPDMRTGTDFRLSGLRGKKVVLLAWSSW